MEHGGWEAPLFGGQGAEGRDDDRYIFQGLPDSIDVHLGRGRETKGWAAYGGEGAESWAPELCVADLIAEVQGFDDAAANGPVPSLVKRKRRHPVGSRNRLRNEPSGNVAGGGGATSQIDAFGNGEGPSRRGKRFNSMECLSIAKAWVYQSSRGPSQQEDSM